MKAPGDAPSLLGAVSICAVFLLACSGSPSPTAGAESDGDRGPSSVERVRQTAQHALHANADEPVACEGCHEEVEGQYLPAKQWKCANCHQQARLVLHAAASDESGARACWSCHDFTGTDRQATSCLSCHEEALGSSPPIVPHDPQKPDEDCGACHRAHQEPTLASLPCESCHDHEQVQVSGHTNPEAGITGCGSCHGYHEHASVASTRCTNCHRQSRAHGIPVSATFEAGHKQCTTCHRPHRFEKSEVIGCQTECHGGVTVLGQQRTARHRRCLNCHNQHDVRGGPQRACYGCHRAIAPRHPADRASGSRCVGCHRPHAGRGAPTAVPCSSCHRDVASDRARHQGQSHGGPACRDCHRPHQFSIRGAGVALCLRCHGESPFRGARTIRPREGHDNCVRCHGADVAHEPAGPRAACATCHAERAAATSQKHRRCVGCHDPHTTRMQRPCGGCHQVQARTAPAGHQSCRQCHDQHTTLVGKSCPECHANRTTGVHRAVPGGCRSCHRPHGPEGPATLPACTSCHRQEALPMLHQNPNHKECRGCHRSHGQQPNRLRATCIACHENKTDHEPTATICIGCHAFGGGE